MNFNEKAQIMNLINHLNPDFSLIKEIHNDDPLNYIEEEKIIVKFINRNKVLYNVKIPVSINKKDLYSIAEKYKSEYVTNILLVHNNSILDQDETSINFISNGDTIIIVEDRYYQDNSYYNFLIKNYNKDMIRIELYGDIKRNFYFPGNISFSEMMKVIYFSMDQDNRILKFLDYRNVNGNDKIKTIFNNETWITINTCITNRIIGGGILYKYGNIINLQFPNMCYIEIGILNSNKLLFDFIECLLCKKVKRIDIKGKELYKKEEKSLFSLGIKEDCQNCKVEFDESKFK